jgi:hypothetical protein
MIDFAIIFEPYQDAGETKIITIANSFAELNYPNITRQPSKAVLNEDRRSDHDNITAIVALVQSPKPERLASLMRTPAGPLDPKGNCDDVQPFPNCCDDLSRHRWPECWRMRPDHQRSYGRYQHAFHRRASVPSRTISGARMHRRGLSLQRRELGRCHRRRPCSIASPHSTPSESFVAWARISPGEENHHHGHSRGVGSPSVALASSREARDIHPCSHHHAASRAAGSPAIPGGVRRASDALVSGKAEWLGRRIMTPTVDIQDAYIACVMAAFKKVTPRTKGNRFGRAKRAAHKRAITDLIKRGYSAKAATQIIGAAHDSFLREATAMRGAS